MQETGQYERRLAAILAIDMVGFSRLMEADEIGTLKRQKLLRRELIDPAYTQFHGRIVKEMGDGSLVEFPSLVEAVKCAVQIQRAMQMREQDAPANQKIAFRIGINLGDIVVDQDDIYGDGVNVAARLESLAEPGGICISGSAFDQMRSTVDVGYEALGDVRVKNIERPIRAYKVLIDPDLAGTMVPQPARRSRAGRLTALGLVVLLAVGVGGWWLAQSGFTSPDKAVSDTTERPSIAVLPFDNLSDDQSQQYFVDGMVEDLITDLSKVPGLFVIARNSSFAFRDGAKDLKQIAQKLGVRHVLEGSVRRAGNRLRINAQLIDGRTNSHVWADRYDGNDDDIFAFQDRITAEIVTALQLALSPPQKEAISDRGTDDSGAYDSFLLGMRILEDLEDLDSEAIDRAIVAFEKSISQDPKYARAYAGLAWANWLYHTRISAHLIREKNAAFAYAEQSLKLGETALAHRVLSWRYFAPELYVDTSDEPELAVAEIRAALEIEPNNPDVLASLADILPFTGKPEEAFDAISKAIELNPNYPIWYLRPLGINQLLAGKYQDAARSLRRWLAGNTQSVDQNLWLVAALANSGEVEEASSLLAGLKGKTSNNIPISLYALNRTWPLPDRAQAILVGGLVKAGFPDALR